MVQWDTEDDNRDLYYVKIEDLRWEIGGTRHELDKIYGIRHDLDSILQEDLMTWKGP